MSSASGGLRPSDPLTITCWCRRVPMLLCILHILNLCDNFVKKVVYEIRKCRQLQRDYVPLSGLCQTDPLTIVCCFRHALNSGVTTPGQLRAVPGMNLFLPGWNQSWK